VKQIKNSIQEKEIPMDYIIFSTGAGVMRLVDSKILFNEPLGAADVKKIVTYFEMRRFDYMVHERIPETQW